MLLSESCYVCYKCFTYSTVITSHNKVDFHIVYLNRQVKYRNMETIVLTFSMKIKFSCISSKLGDSFSGRLAVAATDYKTFVIYWGCTKMSSFGDRCEDPWISIATRNRFPSPKVVNIIENILRARWGIFLGELQRISHTARKSCNYTSVLHFTFSAFHSPHSFM